jgi:hypothetical protein
MKKIKYIKLKGNLIRHGKLKVRKCVVCGDNRSEAHHHEGYSKGNELNILWLCKIHHEKIHHPTPLSIEIQNKMNIDKIKQLGSPADKNYYNKRTTFILKARANRYKYREIGEWFGITRQAVGNVVNKLSTVK